MKINVVITDFEDGTGCSISSDLDSAAHAPEELSSAAVMALLGIKMLFEAGDVWNAAVAGIALIEQGQNPLEVARNARVSRQQDVDRALSDMAEMDAKEIAALPEGDNSAAA